MIPAFVPPLTAVTFLMDPLAGAFVTTVGFPRTTVASRLFPEESSQTFEAAS